MSARWPGRGETSVAAVDRVGRTVLACRAVTVRAGARAGGGPGASAGPAGAVRDPVPAAHRHPVGVSAAGAGFWFGYDVLARPGRLERGRRVGPAARGAAEEAADDEAAPLVAGGDRLLSCPGGPTGPKSGPGPVERARPGSKHHVLTGGQGIPLVRGVPHARLTRLEALHTAVLAVIPSCRLRCPTGRRTPCRTRPASRRDPTERRSHPSPRRPCVRPLAPARTGPPSTHSRRPAHGRTRRRGTGRHLADPRGTKAPRPPVPRLHRTWRHPPRSSEPTASAGTFRPTST